MKKLLFLLAFLPSVVFADFYDVQFYKVDPDTTTITVDWNYRGDIYCVSGDTTTAALIEDCTSYVIIYATGTIQAIDFRGDGSKLTGVSGDNLGNHVATTTLNMAQFDITDMSRIIVYNNTVSSDTSSILGGHTNSINAEECVIGGGQQNEILTDAGIPTTTRGVIGGGYNNTITGEAYGCVIAGGFNNDISSHTCVIGGGLSNEIKEIVSTIGGGSYNTILDDGSVIAGGVSNTIEKKDSTISGGANNIIECEKGTISGGTSNLITGTNKNYQTIGGGYNNETGGGYSTIAGGQAHTIGTANNCFIGGGYSNDIESGLAATIAGGNKHTINGSYASILGGDECEVSADYASILGGRDSFATAEHSTVFGAYSVANGTGSVVGGYGTSTSANNHCQTDGQGSVALGWKARVLGTDSTGSVALGYAVVDSTPNAFCFGKVTNTKRDSALWGVDVYLSSNTYTPNMKTGTTQGNAGAAAGELWADSDDDYTVKLGQ